MNLSVGCWLSNVLAVPSKGTGTLGHRASEVSWQSSHRDVGHPYGKITGPLLTCPNSAEGRAPDTGQEGGAPETPFARE